MVVDNQKYITPKKSVFNRIIGNSFLCKAGGMG